MDIKKEICILREIEVAQCFDELSILEIKKDKIKNKKQKKSLESQIFKLKQEIEYSLGSEATKTIYQSDLYQKLLRSNLDIFNSVDRFKDTEPAILNMKRIEAKRNLQETFFGKTFKEIKI